MIKAEIEELSEKGKIIDKMIFNSIIKNSELIELFNVDVNEMINIKINRSSSIKQKQMYNIYFNPYLLYFCNNINEEVTENLVNFVKYRYLMEIHEIDSKLSSGEINKDDYDTEVNKLLENYFYSSPVGFNIGRIIDRDQKEKIKKFEN